MDDNEFSVGVLDRDLCDNYRCVVYDNAFGGVLRKGPRRSPERGPSSRICARRELLWLISYVIDAAIKYLFNLGRVE